MFKCNVCKQREPITQCMQCECPVCSNCMNDGKCLQCNPRPTSSESDTRNESYRRNINKGECPICGFIMSPTDAVCLRCENLRKQKQRTEDTQSSSTYIPKQQIPVLQSLTPELTKWNWGAFGCSIFWAAAMKQWGWFAGFLVFFVLSLFPIAPIVMLLSPIASWIASIYLGINGSKLAWKSRDWSSIQQFNDTQKVWGIWGKVLFGISVLYIVVLIIIGAVMSQSHQ